MSFEAAVLVRMDDMDRVVTVNLWSERVPVESGDAKAAAEALRKVADKLDALEGS